MGAATIRPLRDADAPAVRSLVHATIERSYAGVYPPRAVAFFKEFHSEEKIRDRARTGTVLVAEQAGRIVATGARVGTEIFAVFVDPDLQGAGLGRALMARLETDARAAGIAEALLGVSLPSRAFYGRLGYQMTAERSRDLGGGERLDFWTARKSLVLEA